MVHSTLTSDPAGPVVVDTVYDSMGRVYSRSNPYRSTTDLSYGLSTYSYDGLGRLINTLEPDGNAIQIKYQGNETTTTDEANNSWSRYVDGAGRLTLVVEPGNFSTTYSYDPAGNLLCADQWGSNTPGSACAGVLSRNFSYDGLFRLLSAFNPETGTVTYSYLNNGQLCAGDVSLPCSRTDANGQTVSYGYDQLNRLTSKSDPNDYNTNMTLSYDQGANGIGRLTQETNQYWGGTQFAYDAMGRVSGTNWWSNPSMSWQTGMGVQYDLAGNIKQLTYPDGRMIAETWDGAGRLQSIADATPNGPQTAYFSAPQTGPQYWPSGALMNSSYGNGAAQSFWLNDRLQPCRSTASIPMLAAAATGAGNLMDRSLYYSTNPPGNCGNEPGNNGNIWSMVDNLQPVLTQGFQYDNLNRLTQGARSDGAYNHTYNYDSFGNMILQDNLHGNPPWSIDPATNRLMNGSSLSYYANGQLANSPGYNYIYTAEGYLRGIGIPGGDPYGVGSYLYNSLGERVVAVRNEASDVNWDAFVYLNSQPMADLNMYAGWTDYIYANGQKIAKVDTQEPVFHMHGVRDGSTPNMGCGVVPAIAGMSGAVAGQTIEPGDKMVYDIQQTDTGGALASVFGLSLQSGAGTGGVVDSSGNQTGAYGLSDGAWHHSVSALSSFAGQVVAEVWAGVQGEPWTGYGAWDIWIANAALVHADGSVVPLFTGQSTSVPGIASTCGGNQQTFQTELTPESDPTVTTKYYLADHLGTTQMELGSGGWPVWEGAFTPFGQEIIGGTTQTQMIQPETPDGTNMHYKFTGKERDAESGLDNFGARYFGSSMGRFISPDWADHPSNIPYAMLRDPQSLNLYSYVLNNPFSHRDSDGHSCDPDTMTTNKDGSVTVTAGACHLDWWDLPGHAFVGLANIMTGHTWTGVKQMAYAYGSALPLASGVGTAGEFTVLQLSEDIGVVSEQAAAETAEVGAQSTNTGKNLNNWETKATPDQVGKNLESQGYTKTTASDGSVQYAKGNTTYTQYPKSQTTGGPSMQIKVDGRVVGKVRMQ